MIHPFFQLHPMKDITHTFHDIVDLKRNTLKIDKDGHVDRKKKPQNILHSRHPNPSLPFLTICIDIVSYHSHIMPFLLKSNMNLGRSNEISSFTYYRSSI